MSRFEFDAIGTRWQIDVFDKVTTIKKDKLLAKILSRITVFDETYSRFLPNSLVGKMAVAAGEYTLPEDAQELVRFYQELYLLSDGLFTPLIGQVLVAAGYDAQYSLQKKTLQKPPSWQESIEYHHPHLKMKKPALLDFGAAGKGYLIDLVGELLKKNGITHFCIDAGGDILYQGKSGSGEPLQPLQVGLEHPENLKQVIGVASLVNQSICGSSGNRRKWKEFTHIINPETLTSPQNILATWVTAEKALYADGLATALFFVPAKKLLKRYNFEYLTFFADHTVEVSDGFPAKVFYQ